MEQDIAAQVVGLGGSTDFSLWRLFVRADFVVKSVIIILLASSIYSWALIFDKYKLFKKINISTEEFENKFWKAKSAESFNNSLPSKSDDPITNIFTTEASIHTNLSRDLYIVLGEGNLNDGWTVKIYHNPLVIWIWIGSLIIFLGGIVSINNNLKKIKI